MKDNPRNRYGAILRERSLRTVKLTRRCSFNDGLDSYQDEAEEWISQAADQTTTIKNQVLVSLQEQERKDMKTVIAEKRNDMINNWKKTTRRRSELSSSLEQLDSRRIQNISWRMWFKDRIKLEVEDEDEQVDLLQVVTGFLPDFSSKMFSPQDLYHSDVVGVEDEPIKSPTSAVQKRLFLDTFYDEYPGVEAA